MKLFALHGSLVGMALLAAAWPAAAEDAAPRSVLAQAETGEAAPDFGQIRKFLAGGRNTSRLDDDRLQQRLARAQRFLSAEGLPPELAAELEQEIAALTGEIERRQQPVAEEPPPQPEPVQEAAPEQAEPPPLPEAEQQAEPEQPAPGPEPVQEAAPEQAEPPPLPEPEQQAAPEQPAPQPKPAPAQQAAPEPTAPQVDPEAERQARAFLDDDTDVSALSRDALRQRLTGIRDLLAANRLSPATREDLRRKLSAEREVLRAGMKAAGERRKPAPADGSAEGAAALLEPEAELTPAPRRRAEIEAEAAGILADERMPEELDEDELVRRIDITRDAMRDQRYSAAERRAFRRALERDRRHLRREMLAERRDREERLRSGGFGFEIVVGGEYDPDLDIPDSVFAAEVEDEVLIDVLAAPPRRRVDRRYTLDDFEDSGEAREAVARIEIDTVHFGFGEGFLREEEIENLDRIARILERILARNPDEVFLLEGHTDAVGSDAANLGLSRERAMAVKDALTTYYVIPPENLRTVGLGERYLKIPTSQPEAENRRVSLARITPLVGGLD